MSELVPSSSGIPEKAYDDPGASEVPAVRDGSGSLEPRRSSYVVEPKQGLAKPSEVANTTLGRK